MPVLCPSCSTDTDSLAHTCGKRPAIHETQLDVHIKNRFYTHAKIPIQRAPDGRWKIVIPFIHAVGGRVLPSGRNATAHATVELQLPTGRAVSALDPIDYELFELLEPLNPHPFTPAWNAAQVDFFKTLSDEDTEMLTVYSYRGDQMTNNQLVYGYPRTLDLPASERSASWFTPSSTVWGRTLLFETQVRRYLAEHQPPGQPVPAANADLAAVVLQWGRDEWGAVLDDYLHDMFSLFKRAPRLTEPLTLYRGARKTHAGRPVMFRPLAETIGTKFNSFTLDCSVASFFARDYLLPPDADPPSEYGTVYRVTFPVGTPLLFTTGCNFTSDVVEMEVRIPPIFSVTATGANFDVPLGAGVAGGPRMMHVVDLQARILSPRESVLVERYFHEDA